MKPRGIEKLSSPKIKTQKEKALARWGDGLFYIVNIVENSEAKKKCVVQFEDKSLSTVLVKDVLKEKCEGESECHVCGLTEGSSDLMECVNCEREYHVDCHKPAISVREGEEFVCRICVFAACAQPGGAKKQGELAKEFKQMKCALPYDDRYLTWDASHFTNVEQCYCYCGGPGDWYNKMLQCCRCRQWFHEACVHSLDEELMVGDRFYMFACAGCNKQEFLQRMDMTWEDIAVVALFHLSMTYGTRWVDLEDHLIPFIKTHLESFGLSKLLLDGRHGQGVIIRQELLNVLGKTSLFLCGLEQRKKYTWYMLRERIPGTPPSVSLPTMEEISVASMTDLTDRKSTTFSPIKFTTTVPAIHKGPIKAVPPVLKSKMKPNKLEMLVKIKSEPKSPMSIKDEAITPDFSNPPSPSSGAAGYTEECDKNNNSPIKQELPALHSTLKPKVQKMGFEFDLPASMDGLTGSPAPVEPVKALDWETNWTLDLAVPPPCNFRGENHPFLTEFEQGSLRRQKSHFLDELHRLSLMSRPVSPLNKSSPASPSTPTPAVMPALDTSSPKVKQLKGFNGELVNLIKQQDPPSSSVMPAAHRHGEKSQTATSEDTIVKPKPLKNGSPHKRRRSTSVNKNENSLRKLNNMDTAHSVNGAKVTDSVFKPIKSRNGIKEMSDSSQNSVAKISDKQRSALTKCLKNLTPTCGFQFPVLSNDYPTVSPDDLGNENLATITPVVNKKQSKSRAASSGKNSRKRGQKRSHSCVSVSPEPEVDTVRRSHRSRKNVQRFEATQDSGFEGLARALTLSAGDSAGESRYDVLSLRSRPDGQVDYLISWSL